MFRLASLATVVMLFMLPSAAEAQSQWGAWQPIRCYHGLDFSFRTGRYNEFVGKWPWEVRFRNRYHETIHLSFVLRDAGSNKKTDSRMSVRPSQVRSSGFFLLKTGEGGRINVLVNKVRFGSDEIGKKYASCTRR